MRLFVHSSPHRPPNNCFHSHRAATSGSDTQDGGRGDFKGLSENAGESGALAARPGTLGKAHFFPAGRVSPGLVGLLPKAPFQTETEEQKPLPRSSVSLLGWGSP